MNKSRHTRTITLSGQIRVAYKKYEGLWLATALEFDIVGYGKDKKSAFRMLQELVNAYLWELATLLRDGKEVSFFNPSAQDEWNEPDVVTHFVKCSVHSAGPDVEILDQDYKGLAKLIEYIDSLDDLCVRLVPVRPVHA